MVFAAPSHEERCTLATPARHFADTTLITHANVLSERFERRLTFIRQLDWGERHLGGVLGRCWGWARAVDGAPCDFVAESDRVRQVLEAATAGAKDFLAPCCVYVAGNDKDL